MPRRNVTTRRVPQNNVIPCDVNSKKRRKNGDKEEQVCDKGAQGTYLSRNTCDETKRTDLLAGGSYDTAPVMWRAWHWAWLVEEARHSYEPRHSGWRRLVPVDPVKIHTVRLTAAVAALIIRDARVLRCVACAYNFYTRA